MPSKSVQALGFQAILRTSATENSIWDVIALRPEGPEITVFWIFSVIQCSHSSEQANPRSAGEGQFQPRGLLLNSWTWREAEILRHCMGLILLCKGRRKEISYSLGHSLSKKKWKEEYLWVKAGWAGSPVMLCWVTLPDVNRSSANVQQQRLCAFYLKSFCISILCTLTIFQLHTHLTV